MPGPPWACPSPCVGGCVMADHYEAMIDRASVILRTMTRSEYAQAVLHGSQRWSGADLRGNAARWSGSYYRARLTAKRAVFAAGGWLAHDRTGHGRVIAVTPVGCDDYGTRLFATAYGPRTADQLRYE
jgi:hypothetical protein